MTERTVTLSEHARAEIDRWVARFPEGRQRSAVISALRVVQHENKGYLTPELMDAVADYLDLPRIQVYEVGTFYSMFETEPRQLSLKARATLSIRGCSRYSKNVRWPVCI